MSKMQHWQTFSEIKASLTDDQIVWLAYTAQLTEALQGAPQYHFQWISEAQEVVLLEHEVLFLKGVNAACERTGVIGYVRCIQHLSKNQLLVSGRTVLLQEDYLRLAYKLNYLKNNPIGPALLYSDKMIKRSPFWYAYDEKLQLWSRLSIFTFTDIEQAPSLLITETFHDFTKMPILENRI